MGKNSKTRRDAKRRKAKKNHNRPKSISNSLKKRGSSGPVMTMMENPFADITHEQRKELVSHFGKDSKEKVTEILASLDEILRNYDPIILISILSGYGLTVGASNNGVNSKESPGDLTQAHVELIQALALQIPQDQIGRDPAHPKLIQEVWDKLTELAVAFRFSGIDEALLESSESDLAINQIQEMMRSHTQMVRNWGFHSQVITISKELYSHFDEPIKNKLGFSASNAIDFFKFIIDLTEVRLTKRMHILADLKSVRNPYTMILKYHELIGQGKEEADLFSKKIAINNISINSLFLILLSHYNIRMPDIYIFDSVELSKKMNVDIAIINEIFCYFSYNFGDLASNKKEFFFLDNPVWKKPIISLSEGYYCSVPQLFFSFVLNILDEVVENIDKEALHKRRADYLELKIEEIVKRRFPDSHVVSGAKWQLDERLYETDLIVFIDSHAIIIEAKSHRISKPALRGAPDRIKKHLEEILIEPGIQSSRLERKLNVLRAQELPEDSLLEIIPVDIDHIKKVIRVSVSLDDFAALQSNFGRFIDASWIPVDFNPCPSMNLASFETLFDFLEHPVQIIHYLLRRTEIEGVYSFIGDELDFMGLYISTLLNIGNIGDEGEYEHMISGMSGPLNKYYASKDQGILIDKPQPLVSDLFRAILSQLEKRGAPRWTEIGCVLNRFPPDDQYGITKFIKGLAISVNKNWKTEGHKNIAVYCPAGSSEYALAIVLFKNGNSSRRDEFVNQAFESGLQPEHVKYCLVIAMNIDKSDMPYHFIGLTDNQDSG